MSVSEVATAHLALQRAFSGISGCTLGEAMPARSSEVWGPDFEVALSGPWGVRRLVCRIERVLHPKNAHTCRLAFLDWMQRMAATDCYPVVLAPFVSERSAALLVQGKVGFADHAGNFQLDLPGAYLDRRVPGNPKREQRVVRSLFTPAAARVLEVLLMTEGPWKGYRLADVSGVSSAHVSHVRHMLVEHGWGESSSSGVRVTRPDELLEAWQKAESLPPPLKRGYTTLHGAALAAAIAALQAEDAGNHVLLAGASAANYHAPYLRTPVVELVASEEGFELIKERLAWREVREGANLLVEVCESRDVFTKALQPVPDVFTTSLLVTYLALARRGDRHAEAAEHLLRTRLVPEWHRLGHLP
jgi:hypothetical protein